MLYFEIWPMANGLGGRLNVVAFSIFSSDGHFVQPSGTILENLEKHFCEIILKSGHWPQRRCCLKIFCFSNFSSGGQLVQWSGTI